MQDKDEGGGEGEQNSKRKKRNKTSDSQESDGGRDQQVKVMRRNSVQSEEYVIFKLKEEEAGFSSLNPIRLAEALKEELGDILKNFG